MFETLKNSLEKEFNERISDRLPTHLDKVAVSLVQKSIVKKVDHSQHIYFSFKQADAASIFVSFDSPKLNVIDQPVHVEFSKTPSGWVLRNTELPREMSDYFHDINYLLRIPKDTLIDELFGNLEKALEEKASELEQTNATIDQWIKEADVIPAQPDNQETNKEESQSVQVQDSVQEEPGTGVFTIQPSTLLVWIILFTTVVGLAISMAIRLAPTSNPPSNPSINIPTIESDTKSGLYLESQIHISESNLALVVTDRVDRTPKLLTSYYTPLSGGRFQFNGSPEIGVESEVMLHEGEFIYTFKDSICKEDIQVAIDIETVFKHETRHCLLYVAPKLVNFKRVENYTKAL